MEVNYVLQCRCNLVDEFHLSICLVITVQRVFCINVVLLILYCLGGVPYHRQL